MYKILVNAGKGSIHAKQHHGDNGDKRKKSRAETGRWGVNQSITMLLRSHQACRREKELTRTHDDEQEETEQHGPNGQLAA